MLHPSYTELMERINKDVEEGDTPIVQSRYSIVKATADRAKQIIDARSIVDKIEKQIKNDARTEPVISDSQHLTMKKGTPLIEGNIDDMKPLSIAIEELYTGKVKISERAETEEVLANKDEASEDLSENNDDESAETGQETEATKENEVSEPEKEESDDAGEAESDEEESDGEDSDIDDSDEEDSDDDDSDDDDSDDDDEDKEDD